MKARLPVKRSSITSPPAPYHVTINHPLARISNTHSVKISPNHQSLRVKDNGIKVTKGQKPEGSKLTRIQ